MSRRLEESYTEFPPIEEAFRAALDESLRPQSPELLYELVAGLGFPEGSLVVDVGCGVAATSWCTSRISTVRTRSSTGCCATAATRSCTRRSPPNASSRGRPSGSFRRSASWRASTDPSPTEDAIAPAGLRIDERVDVGSEWGEWAEEQSGTVGRKLLHAARLLRDPERYRARFGEAAYEIMLGDCLWHV